MARKRGREEAQATDQPGEQADPNAEQQRHKADLETLRRQDPEFYEYLQQTDQELLQFGRSDSEAGDEEPVRSPSGSAAGVEPAQA